MAYLSAETLDNTRAFNDKSSSSGGNNDDSSSSSSSSSGGGSGGGVGEGLLPVHRRKLLLVAGVLRSRTPPAFRALSKLERRQRRRGPSVK